MMLVRPFGSLKLKLKLVAMTALMPRRGRPLFGISWESTLRLEITDSL